MYEKHLNQNWLYPGDIICDLELPNLKKDAFQMVSVSTEEKKYAVRLMMSNEFFVYLSHECDCNDSKRQFFLLTPMLGIDPGLKRQETKLERIIKSNDVENCPHYLNQFYFESSPPLFPENKIIDFTRIISFPAKQKNDLLRKKKLQLNMAYREFLKKKIAYYFIHVRDK